MEDHRGAATGRLVIALPPSVSRTLTSPLVTAFRARFPKATLSVVEGLSTYVLEWLTIGRVDCAVVYNVAPSAAIDLVPVLDEQLYLVSARDPGQPNWLSTAGHARGVMFFRWFLASETPATPTARVERA